MSHLVRSCTLASIVLLILKGTHGKIIVSPSNAVSELNGQVTFQCEGDQFQGTWYISKNGVGSSQEVLIVRPSCVLTPGFEAHYAVDTTGKPNVCNLIVANITMEQAGVYKCDEQDLVYALLTVTVMSPTVTYNKTLDVVAENDDVIITCSLDHNGSVAPASTLRPYFYWTNFNGENESISYSLTTENTAVSKITVRAGRQNITSFSCHAYLELHVNQSNNAGYATNTPPFSKNASSPNIEVLYGPSIPKLTPKPDVITVNEVSCGISVLTCSSNGNPAPNYRWHDSAENGILSTTNNLTLAEINRNYRCEAYNTIRNDVHNESATHTISQNDCTSTGKCCVFPRDEMTSVTVKGCDNGTSCDCLRGYGEITLTCNAKTFPNASYVWSGPYGHVTNSSVYNVIMNGDHRCIAYFNKTLSNYTGDVTFPNGTNETNVQECCASWELAISFVIPYIGGNVIVLVVFLVLYFKQSGFKSLMDNRFPGTTMLKTVLLSIACVCFGLFIIPIVVTVAFCSSLNQGDVASKPGGSIQMDGIPERRGSRQENGDSSAEVSNQQGGNVANAGPGIPGWTIGVMWCVDIVLLFPTTFVAVYFAHCNQMRFEIS